MQYIELYVHVRFNMAASKKQDDHLYCVPSKKAHVFIIYEKFSNN